MVTIAILVALKLGRPVFFTQLRPGENREPFQMIKFRTMTNERAPNGIFLPNEERMTKIGSFLRSTSLDELPELINVIKGEMSLVGPRPLLMDYLPYFTEEQDRRHRVKPGITGWSQVNGRNSINWDKKLKLDIWYVEHQSFLLDLKILLLTIFKVLKKEDINYSEHTAMPRFDEYVKNRVE
jgi:lipopolysaccharide/colanic/teichoic acid biosynthesis glycosyltransferase